MYPEFNVDIFSASFLNVSIVIYFTSVKVFFRDTHFVPEILDKILAKISVKNTHVMLLG